MKSFYKKRENRKHQNKEYPKKSEEKMLQFLRKRADEQVLPGIKENKKVSVRRP
jgi:hypothetical protein